MKEIKLNASFVTLLFALAFASTAHAEGARSYISGSGSDNRPCTRNQPCRSFDGALVKTDEGGEIIALETGTYDATTITKSITLAAAPGADVAIKVTSGNAVTINAGSNSVVVLRGLNLAGPGSNTSGSYGVNVNVPSGACCVSVHVENCIVSGFDRGLNMGLGVAGRFVVSDTVLRVNNYGMYVSVPGTYDSGASVSRSRMEKNSVGILVLSGNSITVRDSVAAGNATGFETQGGGQMDISNCTATKNGRGVSAKGGLIRIASSTVTGNDTGLDLSGGVISSMGNNMIVGNDSDIVGAINMTTFVPR